MSTPQTMDRQTFLSNLRQSGLVTGDQMAKVIGRLPETNRGILLARTLVEQGLLTRFQAELLLSGRTSGFHLGQYRILDHLGRGGMGRVFKAEHQTMSRVVAIKVLAPHLCKTAKAQTLFQREVRAAARLVHPNIVTAYDANQIGDRCYLVMEYVDGPNLDELVRQRGALPIGQACDFIRQAANGLQYAHELGMVHRDIKPANLLAQRPMGNAPGASPTIKILDFGLARLHSMGPNGEPGGDSIMAAENTVLGTPDYLSPEQARNLHNVDIRADLYSLGCTFYFILTGRVPFPGGTTLEKLVRHSTEMPPAPEQLRPDISPPVAAILRRLLAKDPRQRFQTPAELSATLAPFAVQAPVVPTAIPVAIPAGGPPPSTASGSSAWTSTQPAGGPGDDDECAIGQLPMNFGNAPLSFSGLPSMRMQRAVQAEQQRRMRMAIITALGVVGVILFGVAWFVLRR
ncbi:MAG: serine/threonine protein kinase [Gemmataceae bacterium]|nr:serine/threonine protein kinase [Gemmataceae bacterium]